LLVPSTRILTVKASFSFQEALASLKTRFLAGILAGKNAGTPLRPARRYANAPANVLKCYLLLNCGLPEPLKGQRHIDLLAIQTSCRLSARMPMQPPTHNPSEALLPGGLGLLVVLDGCTAQQFDAIDFGRWLSTTIGINFQKALLC